MELVNLGKTGVKVSRICLGCMTYGSSKWRPWVLDEEASRPFFRRAWEAGINFFDTADMYSDGVSEEVLGRALRELSAPREQVVQRCRDVSETRDVIRGYNVVYRYNGRDVHVLITEQGLADLEAAYTAVTAGSGAATVDGRGEERKEPEGGTLDSVSQ